MICMCRTYGLLCVREVDGLFTFSISYIWWLIFHYTLPVGVFISSMLIISMPCYGICTQIAPT